MSAVYPSQKKRRMSSLCGTSHQQEHEVDYIPAGHDVSLVPPCTLHQSPEEEGEVVAFSSPLMRSGLSIHPPLHHVLALPFQSQTHQHRTASSVYFSWVEVQEAHLAH